jgi:flagellar assembly factor FliW
MEKRLMKIENDNLNGKQVDEEEIFYFPNGIIGFENFKKFVLVNTATYKPFSFLISLDQKDFSIPVVNPFMLIEEYQKNLPQEFSQELKDYIGGFQIFCVVNLKGENGGPTLNLKGPIIIDYLKKIGKQVVLTADILTVTYPLN